MRKKGFTLIELLAVIALLALLALFIVPNISKYIQTTNEKMKESQKEYVISAAKKYASENPNTFRVNIQNCLSLKNLNAIYQLLEEKDYNKLNPSDNVCITFVAQQDSNGNIVTRYNVEYVEA